ncbi:hypothetical protein BG74_02090 [Sodalis-like endosymbiont of Proechinophthirus fluctus]|nr:hypothetical protein BG74_02090 [Sodalis-like endosymbiont of Proechinophthirus fluctus]
MFFLFLDFAKFELEFFPETWTQEHWRRIEPWKKKIKVTHFLKVKKSEQICRLASIYLRKWD